MRAITHNTYGPIDGLAVREIPTPDIGEDEVLVRVRAAAVHIGDVFGVLGSPLPVRAVTGLRRPKYGVPGFDIAGIVESVGPGAKKFRRGDEVFGVTDGATAEFVRAREDRLAPKPSILSFEEAAAIPTSATAALHGLRDAGKLQAGQRVLIVGASGGVGTFEVQIAKAMGAEVTAVASTRNVELLRSIGADHVIDHTREDFAAGGPRFDLIVDNIESRSLSDVRRALIPDGTLVLNSGRAAGGVRGLIRLARPIVLSRFSRQNLRRYVTNPDAADLADLSALVEQGSLRPVIDREFPLAETAAALRHVADGHPAGKVVIGVWDGEGSSAAPMSPSLNAVGSGAAGRLGLANVDRVGG
jgi:NADPH:quinone reductase-like Zn-dependent oxidoreductase